MEAAKHLKPCVLELGGKSPAIVCTPARFCNWRTTEYNLCTQILDDANIDEAAKAVLSGAMLFSGQICMSTERVIVQQGIADEFISRLHLHCGSLKAAAPSSDPGAKLCALFSEASAENVLKMIREAQEDGAQVLVGDVQREGSIVQPHIVTKVTPGMRLWDRESFGPGDYQIHVGRWVSLADTLNSLCAVDCGFC